MGTGTSEAGKPQAPVRQGSQLSLSSPNPEGWAEGGGLGPISSWLCLGAAVMTQLLLAGPCP